MAETEGTLRETIAAIHGAIGWISATTTEGNHQIAHHICKGLARAEQLLRAHCPIEEKSE